MYDNKLLRIIMTVALIVFIAIVAARAPHWGPHFLLTFQALVRHLIQLIGQEIAMTSVLNLTVTTRLLAVLGTILFSIIAALAAVWTIGHATLFCFAIYVGRTGGPELVVSPVLAAFGLYLLVESVKEIRDAWR